MEYPSVREAIISENKEILTIRRVANGWIILPGLERGHVVSAEAHVATTSEQLVARVKQWAETTERRD